MTALLQPPAIPPSGNLRRYTLRLPAGLELINSNQSQNPRRRARIVKKIRDAAMEACMEDTTMRAALTAATPGPVLQRAHILGILHPHDERRRDAANWYPSFKAAVDGIVDAGVLEDDDHTRVLGPDMRIGTVVRTGQLVLHIREIGPGHHEEAYR